MPYISAGELDKRIQIIERIGGKDNDGYDAQSEERLVRSCWAKFTRTSGTEVVKANADFGQIKARFLIRYTKTNISRKMIVRYGGNDYEIKYINDYGDAHVCIELWCEQLTLE